MKLSTLTLFCLVPFAPYAQSWCPLGAVWTFAYDDYLAGRFGYCLVQPAEDTVLAGLPAKRLEMSIHAYSFPDETYLDYVLGSHWTTATDDMVQIWDASTET